MSWSDKATKEKVTKAALSMANIRDGGVMVFGVEELSSGVFDLKE